ncbi:cobyric acid synthase CobQ [Haloglomus irregulare]|jgi:adenosylcobyric acid synthase|uniref:Probable cobyric acid synthase n=1 Tax=Haloglomus irregulare TaxID=2234134 RepID=A0A554NF67_9EURY|nr:cobyric acid synthase [Haloglomus irregulare]TSD16031.1 cobyric acid synthase CobQ [Haloglomus irregulare]
MTAGDETPDAHTLLVAGTASHVGKSTVVAGLCRALADAGVDVAPFKAQNMSNNAHVALRPAPVREGDDGPAWAGAEGERGGGTWGEIGVSQHTQARAARVAPTTDLNPVLLKPRGDGESQVIVDGVAVGHYSADSYYEDHWERAREAAVAAHRRLAAGHDVVVAEGAGSIAEINLHDRDLANIETARATDAEVLLVADIERGGVFASLVGTLELLPTDVRERVAGAVINKFRGDRSLLAPGIQAFEDRTGVPVLGVLPYDDPGLPDEDSLSLPARDERARRGGDDGVPDDASVTVAVVRLPRLSNATDVDPLARTPGVRVAFRPPGASLADADAVLLPGTKNAVDDLLACREAGLGDELRAFDGPVLGVCGGYQLLGRRLERVEHESTHADGTVEGFGLLPVVTRFAPHKRVTRAEHDLTPAGPFSAAGVGPDGPPTVSGYEIHAGETTALDPVGRPVGPASAARGNAAGTYCHGLFERPGPRRALLAPLFDGSPPSTETRDPLAAAASLVRGLDLGGMASLPALDGPG